MKVQRFEADEEGYIRVKYMVRPLSFGLFNNKVCFWAIVDIFGKKGESATLIAVKDDQTFDESLIPNYRATLHDNESKDAWHVFEDVPKIIKGKPIIELEK
jgi:hypothetical protein